jgi:hypothetical protein
MNRQKKIKQILKKKAKAANIKTNPKKASIYIAKADRQSATKDAPHAPHATTSPNHPVTDQT